VAPPKFDRETPTFNLVVGLTVKTLREKAHLTQGELASKLAYARLPNWTRDTVTAIEIGRRSLTLEEALSIADVLSVPLTSLLDPVLAHPVRFGVVDPPYVAPPGTFKLSDPAEAALRSASARFGRSPDEIQTIARRLWRRRFETEYRRRCEASIPEEVTPHMESALRATVLRGIYAEIQREIEKAR